MIYLDNLGHLGITQDGYLRVDTQVTQELLRNYLGITQITYEKKKLDYLEITQE